MRLAALLIGLLLATVGCYAGHAQTLEQLLTKSQPGVPYILPAGYKGGGYVRNLGRNPPVVVSCADKNCRLTDVKLQASPGFVFDGLALASGGVNPALAFTSGSHNGGARNCTVVGLKALSGGGISVSDSNNAIIDNCDFSNLSGAINVLRSQFPVVTRNRIHDFSVDAVQFSGSNDVTFTGNEVWNSFPVSGAHNDGVQFFTLNTTSPTHDILIADNVMWRGSGKVFQGVFMGNEAKIPYQNVTMRHNLVCGTMYNGMAIYQTTNLMISGNAVAGYPDMTSWISVSGATGAVQDNAAQQFNTPAAPGLTLARNVVIPAVTDNCAALLTQWKGAPTPPTEVEQLKAEVARLTAELATANATIAALQTSLTAASGALATANAQVISLTQSLAAVTAERDAALTKIAAARAVLQ